MTELIAPLGKNHPQRRELVQIKVCWDSAKRLFQIIVKRPFDFESGQIWKIPLSKGVTSMEAFITQIQQTSMVEWLGAATGLIGVTLSIKEKVLAWPFFIICYGLYAYLSYSVSLYAAMSLNVCFIPFSLYGWWKWGMASRGKNKDHSSSESLAIAQLTARQRIAVCGIGLLATIGIGTVLSRFTEGAFPYLDAFATSISFLAQWMLSRKYIENWIAWFVADAAFIVLWAMQGYWVAVGMFIVFTVLAALGFSSWRKELSKRGSQV